jgi:SRSO17 transposase
MCPLYVSGLIGPGDRKSVQPMAERVALGDAGPVETERNPPLAAALRA